MQDLDSKKEITLFAKTNFRNKEVPFGIKIDDRRRHMYIIGKTGMGKTELLKNLAVQDIQAGRGLAFVVWQGVAVCGGCRRSLKKAYSQQQNRQHCPAFSHVSLIITKLGYVYVS